MARTVDKFAVGSTLAILACLAVSSVMEMVLHNFHNSMIDAAVAALFVDRLIRLTR